ncbi:MAG: hypothetical protein AB7Q29_08835 [Vicinamibacterales bacterium]
MRGRSLVSACPRERRKQADFPCILLPRGRAHGRRLVAEVLLGHVVTKFGTMFRRRALGIVPMWMLPLAAWPQPGEKDL